MVKKVPRGRILFAGIAAVLACLLAVALYLFASLDVKTVLFGFDSMPVVDMLHVRNSTNTDEPFENYNTTDPEEIAAYLADISAAKLSFSRIDRVTRYHTTLYSVTLSAAARAPVSFEVTDTGELYYKHLVFRFREAEAVSLFLSIGELGK